MLSAAKLKKFCKQRQIGVEQLAEQIVRGGLDSREAAAAIRNWKKGLFRPLPRPDDVRQLAAALSVEQKNLVVWRSAYRFAPMSARKVRLITELIAGRSVQDAMDVLKFTKKRAATMVDKVLKAAVADADEQQAEVDNLYVSEARVDDAGIRIGTKRWMPKDRGRAHPIRKTACHIYVTVAEA
jgi:large subunit ribosomal protein L22